MTDVTDYQADPATAKARLFALVRRFRQRKLSTLSFCDQFEHIYNRELDKRALSEPEASALRRLFDKVVWYSPYEDERELVPNYLGDDEIESAVSEAAAAIESLADDI